MRFKFFTMFVFVLSCNSMEYTEYMEGLATAFLGGLGSEVIIKKEEHLARPISIFVIVFAHSVFKGFQLFNNLIQDHILLAKSKVTFSSAPAPLINKKFNFLIYSAFVFLGATLGHYCSHRLKKNFGVYKKKKKRTQQAESCRDVE